LEIIQNKQVLKRWIFIIKNHIYLKIFKGSFNLKEAILVNLLILSKKEHCKLSLPVPCKTEYSYLNKTPKNLLKSCENLRYNKVCNISLEVIFYEVDIVFFTILK